MRALVIETFKCGAAAVYDRLEKNGRMLPPGVRYEASYVTADLTRCFQVMDYDDRPALEEWMARWSDLVDFEVLPVLSTNAARDHFRQASR